MKVLFEKYDGKNPDSSAIDFIQEEVMQKVGVEPHNLILLCIEVL